MFPLFQIITVLNNYINSCENTCGLGTSLPIDSKAPEEDRGRGMLPVARNSVCCQLRITTNIAHRVDLSRTLTYLLITKTTFSKPGIFLLQP